MKSMKLETPADRVQQHIKKQSAAKSRRSQFEEHWDDLSRVMLSTRQGFTQSIVAGDYRMEDVFDGTPMQAARSLANTVGAMIRPEGQDLVEIRAEDDSLNAQGAVQDWVGNASEKLNSHMRNPLARFRQATGEVDLDLVVMGTGILFAGIAKSQRHLIYQSVHLKDGFPMFDDEGNPHGIYRTKKMFIWQAELMFGADNLSKEVREKIAVDKTDDKIDLLYWVGKRKNQSIENPIFAKDFPVEEIWMETQTKHIISEGGFHEFPFIIPRWDTSSGEEYGRSPGMIALPDSNTLQSMGETILVAGQRLADPPIMAPNDGAFQEVMTFPGGISYYDVETAAAVGGNPFFPMISGNNLPVTRDMQTDIRNQVASAFFKNILNLPQGGPQMTATEIIQRKDEFIREVGPVFGRFQTDYNEPTADRSFRMLFRLGAFGEVPELLAQANIKFVFDLPVDKIKKQVQAAAASQWAMEVMQLAQVSPEAKHLVNVDALARFTADAVSLPHEILNTKEEVLQKIAADNAQIAEQRKMEGMEKMAGAAEKGSKAMQNLKMVPNDNPEEQGVPA
jgi:hypothetical protein